MNRHPVASFLPFFRCSLVSVFLLSACLLLPLLSPATASALEKPRVAILEATVSDKVPASVRKYLNLEKLQAEMEASFLATRKFDVVTRNKGSMEAIRNEQQLAESDLAAGDAAATGAIKNANYLVKPEVHSFSFYSATHKVPNLQSKYFRSDHGALEINARILDTTSSEVKATFALKSSFSTRERMVNSRGGVPSPSHFSTLCKKASAEMADQFLALVFPVRIIKVKGNQVYLNRGKDGGFKNGMILNVYSPGEELIDPDTGENLGSAEEYVGQIKVSRINPKFTIATIVTGKQQMDFAQGFIIRKPQK